MLEQYRRAVLAAAFRGELTADWRAAHPEVEPAETLLGRIRAERRREWQETNPRKQYVEPEPVDTDGLPELPEGWCWARAEEVCDWITKGTTPATEKMSIGIGDVPYVKVYNLTMTGELDFSVYPTFVSVETHQGELARSRCYPGDVLMNIVGPPLGKVSVLPHTHHEWNINQAIAVFRPIAGLLAAYLAHHLLREWTVAKVKSHAKATSGQFNLTLEICRNVPVPICSTDEQKEIVRRVEAALARSARVKAAVEAQRVQLDALDRAVLDKAFRGELVPQDPADEPANVMLARLRTERATQGTAGAVRRRGRPANG